MTFAKQMRPGGRQGLDLTGDRPAPPVDDVAAAAAQPETKKHKGGRGIKNTDSFENGGSAPWNLISRHDASGAALPEGQVRCILCKPGTILRVSSAGGGDVWKHMVQHGIAKFEQDAVKKKDASKKEELAVGTSPISRFMPTNWGVGKNELNRLVCDFVIDAGCPFSLVESAAFRCLIHGILRLCGQEPVCFFVAVVCGFDPFLIFVGLKGGPCCPQYSQKLDQKRCKVVQRLNHALLGEEFDRFFLLGVN
jgi:hypothetical protein